MNLRASRTYDVRLEDAEHPKATPDLVRAAQEERLYRLLERRAIAVVLNDPAVRSCETCAHYRHKPCCDYGNDECGCRGLSECAAGAFLSWRHNHEGFDPDGWWRATIDHRVYCPAWIGRMAYTAPGESVR